MNLDPLLSKVTKPARYTGGELNSVVKEPEGKVRFGLAFPDVYEVAMSHLGTHILYQELNRRDDVWAERVHMPWYDMEDELLSRGLSLFTLESRTPIRELDFLGFSLLYELTYSNVIRMLDLGNIPVWARDRDETRPLLIGGGPCTFNPEPLADVFDLFVIGDGEEVVHQIINEYIQWRDRNRQGGKRFFLQALSRITGVYVPSQYRVEYGDGGRIRRIEPAPGASFPVRKALVRDLDALADPVRPIVPFTEVVHDRGMLELFRGCTRGCRFCQAGIIYRPVRERRSERIPGMAQQLLSNTGYGELSLVSLSSADYPDIQELVKDLMGRLECGRVALSLPSLRVDSFSLDLASEIQRVKKTGLTFAPEAGTQRLRNVINKCVTEEDILATARRAFEAGWDSIKLYFMLGLPTETDEDVLGIAHTVSLIGREYSRVKSGRPKISVSTAVFVPKPHTPFQWEPQIGVAEMHRRQSLLAEALGRGVKYSWSEPDQSLLEAILSRGDRRLGPVIVSAARAGARLQAWSEFFDYNIWRAAMEKEQLDAEFYANRQRDSDEVLPWDHIDSGVSKEYLWRERERAFSQMTTPDCRSKRCLGCGITGLLAQEKGGALCKG